jgi:hypothetical protein
MCAGLLKIGAGGCAVSILIIYHSVQVPINPLSYHRVTQEHRSLAGVVFTLSIQEVNAANQALSNPVFLFSSRTSAHSYERSWNMSEESAIKEKLSDEVKKEQY